MARSDYDRPPRQDRAVWLSQNVFDMKTLLISRHGLLAICTAIAVLALATECFDYLRLAAYIDHIENMVVINGWQYLTKGMALYQLQDGTPRFATFYGPLTYLSVALAPLLLGAGIVASKLAPLLAVSATVILMAVHFFRRSTVAQALPGFFFVVTGLLLFSPMSFWTRADPFETLLVAIAVLLAARPLAIGIAIGLAVNFKVHAFVYFLPILVEMLADRRWRALLTIAATSSLVFFIPFLMPGISLHDYVAVLAQQAGHRGPTSRQNIVPILTAIWLLGVPLVWTMATEQQPTRDRIYALAALAALILLIYPANLPGSGSYHLLPLVPVLAEAFWRLRPQGSLVRAAVLPTLITGLWMTHLSMHTMAMRRGWDPVAADALALAQASPTRPVQIGYGENESYEISQLSRTLLSLNGHPALIDAQSLIELQQIGIDGSTRWLPYLTECGVKRWLMPKGETPFATTNYYYDSDAPLFDPEFRQALLSHYRVVSSGQYFNVWECAEDAGGAEKRQAQ
jgi:hypothetical protein